MIPNDFQSSIGSGIKKNVGYQTQPKTVGCLETLNSFRVVEKGVRALLRRMVRSVGVGSPMFSLGSRKAGRAPATILAMAAIVAIGQAEPTR